MALSQQLLRLGSFLLVVALGYANSLHAPFIFDDNPTIVSNPCIQSLHPFLKIFSRVNLLDITCWGRPTVALSLALNYAAGRLDVLGYHLFNITVHLLNGCLLWQLAYGLLRDQKWSPACSESADMISWWITLLWLAHPLATSVATYIVQRAESMMAFFYLLTLLSAEKFWSQPHRWGWGLLSIVSCSLGMLTKESMVTAPLAVLLLGVTFHLPIFIRTVRQYAWWPLGLASSWLVLAWVMQTWPRQATVGAGSLGMSSWEYFLIQTRVIPHYFGLILFPSNLSLNYPQRLWESMSETPSGIWPLVSGPGSIWPEAGLLIALLLGLLWLLWKHPGCGSILLLAFLILAPTSSFIPIVTSLAADHRMYLPSAAVMALLVIGLYSGLHRLLAHRSKLALGLSWGTILLVLVLTLQQTIERNGDYLDEVSIWEKSLRLHPQDALGWNELGRLYYYQGRLLQATQAFDQGSRICDNYLLPLSNLAVCQWCLGNHDECLKDLRYILGRQPRDLLLLYNLADFLKKIPDHEDSRLCLRLILRADPNDDDALEQLAQLEN